MESDFGDVVRMDVGDVSGAEEGLLPDFLLHAGVAFLLEAEPFCLAQGILAVLFFPGFPAFPLQSEPFGLIAGPAQLGELLGGARDGPALFDRVGGDEDLADQAAESEEGGKGGAVGEGVGARHLFQVVGFFGELSGPGAGIFVAEPVFEPTLTPLAEVLFVDGASAEVRFEDSLRFGKGVEPGDEAGAGFAVGEAAVELVAKRARETGDFTSAHSGKEVMGLTKDEGRRIARGRERIGVGDGRWKMETGKEKEEGEEWELWDRGVGLKVETVTWRVIV